MWTNFGADQHITPGDKRPIELFVEGAEDFEGWEFALFIVNSLRYNGLDELEENNLLKPTLTAEFPNVSFPLGELWPVIGYSPQVIFHEFWRTDAGNETRLARGFIRVVN